MVPFYRNIDGRPSNSQTLTTLEAAPEGPPRDLIVRQLNSSSSLVKWSRPSHNQRNGIITGYQIYVFMDDSETLLANMAYRNDMRSSVIRQKNVCNRPWTFERVPNKMLRGLDNALIFTATKESCLAACLNEKRFVCSSAEYNYITTKCHLSEHDRRSVEDSIELVDAQGVDYFENLCLKAGDACRGVRQYAVPSIGVADDRVAHHVGVYFYVDKELLASNEAACQRACQVENEFLCRSYRC